jgi:hypothetical protein
VIEGINSEDSAGWSVGGAGGINGDGFADLLIGALSGDGAGNSTSNAGEAYVIFGKANMPTTLALSSLGTNGTTLFGETFNHQAGNVVSGAGDVNGDGCDDILVGTFGGDASYLVYGSPSMPTTINLGSLGAAGIRMFPGDDYALSSAGDVNGDGFDDILLGGPALSAGRSRVVFGGDSLPATLNLTTLGAAGFTLIGQDSEDYTGRGVSSAGDVNGDGFDDLLIGAYLADGAGNTKSNSGQSYIVFGAASFPTSISLGSLGSAGVTIFGVDVNDYWSVKF